MADVTDAEYEAATERGRQFRVTAPHARAAHYDAGSDRIVVDLENNATFAFPPALAERLAGATSAALSDIEIVGEGYGLHWPALNEDLAVPALLEGVFGTVKWMDALATRGLLPGFRRAA